MIFFIIKHFFVMYIYVLTDLGFCNIFVWIWKILT